MNRRSFIERVLACLSLAPVAAAVAVSHSVPIVNSTVCCGFHEADAKSTAGFKVILKAIDDSNQAALPSIVAPYPDNLSVTVRLVSIQRDSRDPYRWTVTVRHG